MTPLYYFKLNKETGEIIKTKIADYEEKFGSYGQYKHYYRWKGSACYMYCFQSDMDIFKNGHVYSFNSDIEEAKRIMVMSIKERADKAFTEANKWMTILHKILGAK